MKKLLSVVVVVLIAVVGAVVWSLYQPQPTLPEHQVFLNGRVFSMDANNTVFEAVAVRGERIEAVGGSDEIRRLITADTVVHDLNGRSLLPGFIDAHGHFPGSGLRILSADLNSPPIGGVRSIGELQAALRDLAERQPGDGWLLGMGYDDTLLGEARHPTRQELDAVSAQRPILIVHISGHMGVANSAALAAVGIDDSTPNPDGGVIVHDAQGVATGLLQETALDDIRTMAMDFSPLDFLRMVDDASAEYLSLGVTTAQSGGIDARMLQGMSLFSKLGRIPLRLELWPLWNQLAPQLLSGEINAADFESDRLRVGAVKFITDGSIQGYTGFLAHPYHTPYHGDADYRGFPTMSSAELDAQMLRFHRAGMQLALHGNGDAAIGAILDGYAKAQQQHHRDDARPIVIHAQMAREDQLDRMVELGVTPSFFSAHTYYWGDRHRDIFIGPERAQRISPTRSAVQRGLPFTVHLDTPVVPMNPLLLLWSTVNRETASGAVLGAEQQVSVMQALRAMTADAAWQIHREHEIGSIEPGKFADLVLLSDDPRQRPQAIRDIQVEATYIGGRRYF